MKDHKTKSSNPVNPPTVELMDKIEKGHYNSEYEINPYGLTKREHFAGLAMQGLLSCDAKYNGKTDDRQSLSQDALAFADALITELNK